MIISINANSLLPNNRPKAEIIHKDEVILFSVSIFGRLNFKKDFGVFDQINKYLLDLPEGIQDKIFKIYKDISDSYLELGLDVTEFSTDKVKELYDLVSHDSVEQWLAFKGDLIIPHYINEDYVASVDFNTTREKTYTKKDYKDLMSLSFCFRLMIPIWGEYIANTRKEKGTHFKEFYAFHLLNKTRFEGSLVIVKLSKYIDSIIGNENALRPGDILKWVSSEDFNYWMLSVVCIKKLSICDIRGVDPDFNPIAYLYKYISHKSEDNDNNFENLYKEKKFDKEENSPEGKLSILEVYKIKSNISPGEKVELEFCLKDMFNVTKKLVSYVDVDLYNESMQSSAQLIKYPISLPQIMLLSWVFKPVISPKGIVYLDKKTIVNSLGALEVVLWSRNYKYLALLATSYSRVISDEDSMSVTPIDSKIRINEELSNKLHVFYPYTRPKSTKKNNLSINQGEKFLIDETIDRLTEELTIHTWVPTANKRKIDIANEGNVGRIIIKPDIKTHIAELLLELGSRKK